MKLFTIAANQKCANAEFNIGNLYSFGLGVEKDFCEAEKWYIRAKNDGYSEAYLSLALLYFKGKCNEKYLDKAKEYFKIYCNVYNESNYYLGLIYFNAEENVQQNKKLGFQYFTNYVHKIDIHKFDVNEVDEDKIDKKSSNYYNALNFIGFAFLYGKGVEKNIFKAYHPLYLAATVGDNPSAQFYLGLIYCQLPDNYDNNNEAIKWLKKASSNGYTNATLKLKELGYQD
ncbi:MAG TPA: tetratricopeptide repeat protein [Saprospiraceae bacterium]|nr:tetratricopeptide repeat protein [Saprospiraceae bacterium]